MTLRLFNTLTKSKEEFVPLDAKNVRMYVCGPTVYDFAHIGNARPAIVFDVLFRLLRHIYGDAHVTYARNITDVDDKINARAKERGISIRELTEETARIYNEDVAALGCLPPSIAPRATEHIPQMIAMIGELIADGHAYAAGSSDGNRHVLFDVSSKADYGKLARRSLDEMIAGARVDVAPYKKGAMDFVLWKPSEAGLPGWESPWGRGRPGWHIECSAMAGQYLGQTFDIHGGGIDLMFPHHENEIAQSECAHGGAALAKVWMHNGFLQVEGEKMSKSLGNFFTIRELLERYPGGALRLAMMQTHYRQPINWMASRTMDAWEELRDWAALIYGSKAEHDLHQRRAEKKSPQPHPSVLEALGDDLNTSEAITAMRELYKKSQNEEAYTKLIESAEFLGLYRPKTIGAYASVMSATGLGPDRFFELREHVENLRVAIINGQIDRQVEIEGEISKHNVGVDISYDGYVTLKPLGEESPFDGGAIQRLITARNSARAAKDFKESDRIRDELLAKGIVLKDGPQGTTWEIKR